MAMLVTVVPVCNNGEMTVNLVNSPKKCKPLIPKRTANAVQEPISLDSAALMLISADSSQNFRPRSEIAKLKPLIPKLKGKGKTELSKPTIMPENINEQSIDTKLDSESSDDARVERWINGDLLLVSLINSRIYDPVTMEHIGTMMEETIDWCC